MADAFVVQGPGDRPRVETWSTERLPYEPTGRRLDHRTALRDALGRLEVPDGGAYWARYSSAVDTFCDVENVLFYNVGPVALPAGRLGRLTFERAFAPPPPCPALPAAAHHHRYEVGEIDPVWRPTEVLASFGPVAVADVDVATVWRAVAGGPFALRAPARRPHVGLALRVGLPNRLSVDGMKKMLDGVVSAFHHHDGTDLEVVSGRLATQLAADPAAIASLLLDDRRSALGERRLVRPWRTTVQWNPADERLVRVDIRGTTAARRTIAGELTAIEPS